MKEQSKSNTSEKKSALLPVVAGCLAGAIEATCVWPMEFMKTRLQLSEKGAKLPYNGTVSGILYTVRTSGFLSLYRGLAPTLIGSVPKAGIRFGLNAAIKDSLRDEDGKLTITKNLFSGLAAGVAEALCIVTPVETVKTKCIALDMPFLKGLSHIVKTEGISGIYLGSVATALKQGSNCALRFAFFNEYKRIITNDGEIPMTPLKTLIGGMSAGCFSTLGNNPFDVVKTRLQGTNSAQYRSTFDCFKQVLTKEGIGAFYIGILPRLGRVVPGQGIVFMTFEMIQDRLEPFFAQH